MMKGSRAVSGLDWLRLGLAVMVARAIAFLVRRLRLGAASVLPGTVARRLQPQILSLLCRQVTGPIVLIAGTNGKTTTSLLLRSLLTHRGWQIVHNAAGANLENGLITALLERTSLVGRLGADCVLLEVDENVLPKVLAPIQPQFILCLNLFRDPLDRYGEVDTISQRWRAAMSDLPSETTVVLNADDPTLSYLGQQLSQRTIFFGLNQPADYLEEIPHAVDSIYCPACGASLDYQGVYLSHLGDFQCPQCGFKKSTPALESQDWPQILIGLYNKYNTLAAVSVAKELQLERGQMLETIANFRAAFGRAEELRVGEKSVRILLSKNPVGMNETIRTVNQVTQDRGQERTLLLVLNDRIPDGTDVSWIWDVDTEKLVQQGGSLVISGDRAYDMALRLQYSQVGQGTGNGERGTGNGEQESNSPLATNHEPLTMNHEPLNINKCQLIVKEELQDAIATALELTPTRETLYILPTYSAMLEVREVLTGRKIL